MNIENNIVRCQPKGVVAMIRTCRTCARSESHRWCCIRERLRLASNDLSRVFWERMEEVEAGFLRDHGVGVKFGADLLIDFQVYTCPRWIEQEQKELSASIG